MMVTVIMITHIIVINVTVIVGNDHRRHAQPHRVVKKPSSSLSSPSAIFITLQQGKHGLPGVPTLPTQQPTHAREQAGTTSQDGHGQHDQPENTRRGHRCTNEAATRRRPGLLALQLRVCVSGLGHERRLYGGARSMVLYLHTTHTATVHDFPYRSRSITTSQSSLFFGCFSFYIFSILWRVGKHEALPV